MEEHAYDDLQSMDVDDSQRDKSHGFYVARGRFRSASALAKGDHVSVVNISESSACSSPKNQKEIRTCDSEPEVDSLLGTKKKAQEGPTVAHSLHSVAVRTLGKHAAPDRCNTAPVKLFAVAAEKPNTEDDRARTATQFAKEPLKPVLARINARSSDENAVPLLFITELSEIAPRFAIEGKILNNYGTFKLRPEDAKFPRYFKVDIVDACNSDTVTVVVEDSLLPHFEPKFPIGKYVRVEGASVKRKNRTDGGTCIYSLHVDAATNVYEAVPFPISLSFYPECGVHRFLDEAHVLHAQGNKQHLGTIAFVVIQIDNLEARPAATRGELLIADGPALSDRAMLTFVNDRKDDYVKIVRDVEGGSIVMAVARNIGVFMSRDNTLSVLDLTILLRVQNASLRKSLLESYDKHMEYLGYGKEVEGELTFVNINDMLLETICYICKSTKVHMGVNSGASKFAIERKAINEATFRCPDEMGWQPQRQPIILEDGALSHIRETTFPVPELVDSLVKKGFNVAISDDAGRFVCNYVYYYSLHHAATHGTKCLFVHVPPFSKVEAEKQIEFMAALFDTLSSYVLRIS